MCLLQSRGRVTFKVRELPKGIKKQQSGGQWGLLKKLFATNF